MLRFALIKDLQTRRMNVGRLTMPRICSSRRLIPLGAEWICQVQLDGEGERGTAGGNRTGEGVLKVSLESQFNKFVWNDI